MGDFELFGVSVSLGTMLYQVILFTVLFWILRKKAMPKILRIFEERRVSIEQQIQSAHDLLKEAQEKEATMNQLLEEAKKEAKGILRKSREEAEVILKEAQKEAHTIRSEALQQVKQSKAG